MKEQLEEILGEPVEGADDAERAREAADLLAAYHRLHERVLRLVSSRSEERPGEKSLAGMTLHDAAERVLEEAGTPLHARELGARIKAGGWRHPRSKIARPEQILHQLSARLPRYPERFRRIAPQTFALTGWGDDPFSRPARKVPAPVGLFRGPGTAIGERTGTSEEPLTDERAAWRSS